mmetsp:Transcript_83465/g.244703  ORF Transcript_83465/g.244703 Transcript_83465/m.244703 type:complete len:248 (-) Transcript_83465:61-804(-)
MCFGSSSSNDATKAQDAGATEATAEKPGQSCPALTSPSIQLEQKWVLASEATAATGTLCWAGVAPHPVPVVAPPAVWVVSPTMVPAAVTFSALVARQADDKIQNVLTWKQTQAAELLPASEDSTSERARPRRMARAARRKEQQRLRKKLGKQADAMALAEPMEHWPSCEKEGAEAGDHPAPRAGSGPACLGEDELQMRTVARCCAAGPTQLVSESRAVSRSTEIPVANTFVHFPARSGQACRRSLSL